MKSRCPKCERELDLNQGISNLNCPYCNEEITIEKKICPFCAELINIELDKCNYCENNLIENNNNNNKKKYIFNTIKLVFFLMIIFLIIITYITFTEPILIYKYYPKNIQDILIKINPSKFKVIEYLEKYNITNINELDEKGNAPIHYAVINNSKNEIKELVKLEIDINLENQEGLTPLSLAIKENNTEITLLLLDLDAKVVNEMLFLAIKNENIHIIKKLIYKNINVNSFNENGLKPIHVAEIINNEEIINILLLAGTNYLSEETIAWLNDEGYSTNDLNSTCNRSFPPIITATIQNRVKIVKELIKSGADVNIQTSEGRWSALHYAADSGFIDVTRELINGNANLDINTIDGGTPLFIACWNYNNNIMEILLAAGANPDLKVRGCPIIRIAAEKNNYQAALILVRYNAKLLATAPDGYTAYEYAEHFGYNDIATLLKNNGGRIIEIPASPYIHIIR